MPPRTRLPARPQAHDAAAAPQLAAGPGPSRRRPAAGIDNLHQHRRGRERGERAPGVGNSRNRVVGRFNATSSLQWVQRRLRRLPVLSRTQYWTRAAPEGRPGRRGKAGDCIGRDPHPGRHSCDPERGASLSLTARSPSRRRCWLSGQQLRITGSSAFPAGP